MVLKTILQENTARINQIGVEEIKNILLGMKSFLQTNREEGEVWEEIYDAANLSTGRLNTSLINFLTKILDRLVFLAKNGKRGEIDLNCTLLEKFLTHYVARGVPENLRGEQFFLDTTTEITTGIGRNPKRTAWGEFLLNYVLNAEEGNDRIDKALNILRDRKKRDNNISEIRFYRENESWGGFSNYFHAEIEVRIPTELDADGEVIAGKGYLTGNLTFSTSEALFHALKFTQAGNVRLDIIKRISGMTAGESKQFANTNQYNLLGWWKGENHEIPGYNVIAMKWAVREKFKQNPKLLRILINTGDAKLIENTPADKFWGDGGDGSGSNKLGEILMDIRKEVTDGKIPIPETPNPTSPQPDPTKPTPNESPDTEELNNNLFQIQTKAITEITDVLNQNPKIIDSELSKNYHDWREKLKKIKEEKKIKTFKNEVIADIHAKRRDKQQTNRIKNDIENAQGKSGEELRKDLEKIKKNEGEKFYEEQRKSVEELSKKSVREDPGSYSKMVVNLIKDSLLKNLIEESELEKDSELKTDWEKIKKSEIDQPEEIIVIEKKITKKVGELGAQKRFNNMVETVNKSLKSGEKKHLQEAVDEIIKFINSGNIYDQAIYSQREDLIKELRERAENYSPSSLLDSPAKFPWTVVVPIAFLAALVIAVVIMISRKRKLRKN